MRRILTALLLIAVVMGAGVTIGRLLGGRAKQQEYDALKSTAPTALLAVGDRFPSVALLENGDSHVVTDELVSDGAVVVFVDLDCPPCTVMASNWNSALERSVLGGAGVFGIAFHPTDAIADYRSEHQISFPIYQDYDGVFFHDYQVNRFPLEVVVATSGRILSVNYDVGKTDESVVAGWLAE